MMDSNIGQGLCMHVFPEKQGRAISYLQNYLISLQLCMGIVNIDMLLEHSR